VIGGRGVRSRLKTLELDGLRIGLADLTQLRGLSQLLSLTFDSNTPSDVHLAELADLSTLRHLGFGRLFLTDDGLAPLKPTALVWWFASYRVFQPDTLVT
jgi:hypothetical protein